MRRISVPVDNALYNEFDKRLPHGIKAAAMRSLLRILLSSPESTVLAVASNENKPNRFEIKEKDNEHSPSVERGS